MSLEDRINMLIDCPLHNHRNTSVKYFSTDTEEHYIKTRNTVANWAWSTVDISYDFNSQGYRMKELSHVNYDNYFLALGCSHTVGVGLPVNLSYTNTLASSLNMDFVNAGVNSGSNEIVLMNLTRVLKHAPTKPKFIIIQWTYPTRKMYFLNNKLRINIESDKGNRLALPDSYYDYLDNPGDIGLYFNEIRNTSHTLCELAGVKLIEFKVENIGGFENFSHIKTIKCDFGWEGQSKPPMTPKYVSRDNVHPGVMFQKEADTYIKASL